jgi:hypothetical protein
MAAAASSSSQAATRNTGWPANMWRRISLIVRR